MNTRDKIADYAHYLEEQKDVVGIVVSVSNPRHRMKINELMVGNHVIDNKSGIKGVVTAIGATKVQINHCIMVQIKDVLPISLTEEWLVKFGFGVYSNVGQNKCFGIEMFVVVFWFNSNPTKVLYDGVLLREIQFVHQLQNLYFALTGIELTTSDKSDEN